MQNKTLKDVLIDLYYSGDLVPVWEGPDESPFVTGLEMENGYNVMRDISDWFLRNNADIVSESLCDSGPEIADCQLPESLGWYVLDRIKATALEWAEADDDWAAAMAHITELERSR